MWVNEWEVLLVDDEPDVISVSKLAIQNFDVYGLPLKISTAASKAEAIEWLNNRPDRHAPMSMLAVAFVDVVMETDSAGLELCQAIREEMGNRLTQIFVRTGQPGIAPERQVIDRYDINGYFTKAEATEDKLYTLIKSGVRQYYWSLLSQIAVPFFNTIISSSHSQEKIMTQYRQMIEMVAGMGATSSHRYEKIGDTTLFLSGWDEQTGEALMDQLDQLEGVPLSAEGDKFAVDDNGHLLITVAPRPDRTEVKMLLNTAFTPPVDTVRVVHGVTAGLGMLWHKAA